MPESGDTESNLVLARDREKDYDWIGAINFYEKALNSTLGSRDFLKSGEIGERIGFCYERASLQAEKTEEFGRRAELASKFYKSAAELFLKSGGSQGRGRSCDCNAVAAYIDSWLAPDPSRRRKLLDSCWRLQTEALKIYKDAEDKPRYGKTCNELLRCLLDRSYLAPDWPDLNRTLEEAASVGESAIATWSELMDNHELSRAYSMTSLHYFYAANISEQEEKTREFGQKCLSYAQKALELSRLTGDRYLFAVSNWAVAIATLFFSDKVTSSLAFAEEMLQQGMITKDNYIFGVASYLLGFINYWIVPMEEDPDKIRNGYESVMKRAEDAIHHLGMISHDYFLATTYHPYVESFNSLASEVETILEKKRALLESAVKAGRNGLEHARRSGSPETIGANLHALSKALFSLSIMETKTAEKKKLLEEALRHREEYVSVVERAFPSSFWVRGVGKNYEALIRAELTKVETEKENQMSHLGKAVSSMEDCLKLCKKWTTIYPQTRLFAVLGEYYNWFGGILTQLHSLTGDAKALSSSIEAYEGAIDVYKKIDLPSRLAEGHWRIAMLCERLGEHVKASENFEFASNEYETAAGKIPLLKDFYSDYANYMRAWSEIEKAKLNHSRERYSQSRTHYEKAASHLDSSKLWKYLAPNFAAWAFFEHAEDLSRTEKSQEAIQVFKQTAQLFAKAKSSLEAESDRIERLDEREEAMELSRACSRRAEYCMARVSLEEARILDKEGEDVLSAEKYGSAAKMFERLVEAIEVESDRREIMPLIYTCQAWQKMVLGEEKAHAELYAEASELFLKARECSLNDRTGLLAMGNHSFCKALEFGTIFESTKDGAHFLKAKQYLDSASKYYMRTGHESSAVWINATQVLFDAYVYMSQAEVELDPRKKHERYLLAEKCLERAAELYEKAGYIGKRNEVARSLEKVKEKREFTFSLGEVLKAPSITLSTAGVMAPTIAHEDPVGLQRFEHADIQANLIAYVKEAIVGGDIELELELANAGKGSALLMRVEGIVPKGFEMTQKPETYRLEDGHLNLKGKKLGPLKTEEMRLVLKAKTKGTFSLKPRILYQDETGEYKSHEPEPATITVKELGIWRWIRGPGK